jgi:hypothetical protein
MKSKSPVKAKGETKKVKHSPLNSDTAKWIIVPCESGDPEMQEALRILITLGRRRLNRIANEEKVRNNA